MFCLYFVVIYVVVMSRRYGFNCVICFLYIMVRARGKIFGISLSKVFKVFVIGCRLFWGVVCFVF